MLSWRELSLRLEQDSCYEQQFGGNAELIGRKRQLVRQVCNAFLQAYGPGPEDLVAACFVPGRVEILGKHTDYAGGCSLLAAVDRGFFCLSSPNHTGSARFVEVDSRFAGCEFPVSSEIQPIVGHWSNYPMTMVKRLASNFGPLLGGQPGVNVAFGSDLPVAAGLSGSSALMIMTYFAVALPNDLAQSDLYKRNIVDPLDLAMYLACAENGQSFRELPGSAGVGTFGGSEDHTEILNGRAGKLSLFRFCPTRHLADVAWPDELGLVIANSGVKAEKTGAAMSRYNQVSRRARSILERYNSYAHTEHQTLRELFSDTDGGTDKKLSRLREALAGADDEKDLLARFEQFYCEDGVIIPKAVDALRKHDYTALGACIDRSHALSARNLGNIIPEIDWLQQSARQLGAIAASGFGAGFGGSAYALVMRSRSEDFVAAWRRQYLGRFPQHQEASEFFCTMPCAGAGEWFRGQGASPRS